MLVLLVKIGVQSEKYWQSIISPSKVVLSYKETYCVHSVRIVRWTQVLIIASIWVGVFNAFTCIIGPNYRSWFLNSAFKDCLPNQEWYQLMNTIEIFDMFILLVGYNLRNVVVIL